MDRIVIDIFDDCKVAEKAIDELTRAGVSSDRIFMLGSSEKCASSLSEKEYEAQLTKGRVLIGISTHDQKEERSALEVFDAADAMSVH